MGKNWRGLIFVGIALLVTNEVFAARKDFKGMFGSYRREKFTENEARTTDLGVDLLLSTMLPMSSVISSGESTTAPASMPGSLFFNVEASFFVTLDYNWELFANIGWFNYDNRRENQVFTDPTKPLFHEFEFEAFPVTLGVKYRFSTEDIVPYVGLGAGMAYTKRHGFYDYNSVISDTEYTNCIVAQILVGIEFFFSANAGIRLETSAYNFRLSERTFSPGGNFPTLVYNGNPWLVRYASGVFFLF